ncbi:hypothetical protein BKA67DRAFT_651344 [Truncatella angustata]|uniref:MARVEL domain-containing protein n=1 Tax=Truncatella angustata TaxID=152316 RepID=A0A9P8RGJ4_9PEZI|nr:uncharacterized protein BKA67DRAFT_651344 [Truncatella angustata]KAH6645609.1 hypothetical protein BKA67DRAFT_651344 [Truncatella angustata]
MGSASKVLSVLARISELVSSVIVLGLLGRFLYLLSEANVYADSRIIYTTVVASISAFVSIILFIPFTYSFLAFPLDFILFVLWLVAFCLLEALTGTHACSARWYWNYWGYYWGGYWRDPIVVGSPADINWAGCSSWQAVLAWTFISSMLFLLSSCLGAYVVLKYREEKKERGTIHNGTVNNGTEKNGTVQNGIVQNGTVQNGAIQSGTRDHV